MSSIDRRWEINFQLAIPEFHGGIRVDPTLDWLVDVEEILESQSVSEDQLVSLVVKKFRGEAASWWQQVKMKRKLASKSPIKSWDKLKQKVCATYLPRNYDCMVYNRLQNLKRRTPLSVDYKENYLFQVNNLIHKSVHGIYDAGEKELSSPMVYDVDLKVKVDVKDNEDNDDVGDENNDMEDKDHNVLGLEGGDVVIGVENDNDFVNTSAVNDDNIVSSKNGDRSVLSVDVADCDSHERSQDQGASFDLMDFSYSVFALADNGCAKDVNNTKFMSYKRLSPIKHDIVITNFDEKEEDHNRGVNSFLLWGNLCDGDHVFDNKDNDIFKHDGSVCVVPVEPSFGNNGLLPVVCVFLTPVTQDNMWFQTYIFQSACPIGEKAYRFVISLISLCVVISDETCQPVGVKRAFYFSLLKLMWPKKGSEELQMLFVIQDEPQRERSDVICTMHYRDFILEASPSISHQYEKKMEWRENIIMNKGKYKIKVNSAFLMNMWLSYMGVLMRLGKVDIVHVPHNFCFASCAPRIISQFDSLLTCVLVGWETSTKRRGGGNCFYIASHIPRWDFSYTLTVLSCWSDVTCDARKLLVCVKFSFILTSFSNKLCFMVCKQPANAIDIVFIRKLNAISLDMNTTSHILTKTTHSLAQLRLRYLASKYKAAHIRMRDLLFEPGDFVWLVVSKHLLCSHNCHQSLTSSLRDTRTKEKEDLVVTRVQGSLEATFVLTEALYGQNFSKLHFRHKKKRHQVLQRKYYELVEKGYLQSFKIRGRIFLTRRENYDSRSNLSNPEGLMQRISKINVSLVTFELVCYLGLRA